MTTTFSAPKKSPTAMTLINMIAVDDEPVLEVNIRIWPGSTFVLRTKAGDITFHNLRVEDKTAYCTVGEGSEILRKVRAA